MHVCEVNIKYSRFFSFNLHPDLRWPRASNKAAPCVRRFLSAICRAVFDYPYYWLVLLTLAYFIFIESRCHVCDGRGKTIEHVVIPLCTSSFIAYQQTCHRCGGRGVVTERTTLRVPIPAGALSLIFVQPSLIFRSLGGRWNSFRRCIVLWDTSV